jgi:hypothetical protein
MSRRHLLALLCVPASLPAAADVRVTMAAPGPLSPWDCLILQFDHRDDLAAVGAACLHARPVLRSFEAAVIYRALAHRVGAPTECFGKVFLALPAQIATDYESGAMENVGGWQLSHTEVLLAVLAMKSDSRV